MDFKKQLMIDMGKRLVALRKQLNLTQEEIAEKADVSQQAISDAENAKTMLMPDTMLKLSRAYNISCDFLLTGKIADVDVVRIDKRVRNLDSDQFSHYQAITDHYLAAIGVDEN